MIESWSWFDPLILTSRKRCHQAKSFQEVRWSKRKIWWSKSNLFLSHSPDCKIFSFKKGFKKRAGTHQNLPKNVLFQRGWLHNEGISEGIFPRIWGIAKLIFCELAPRPYWAGLPLNWPLTELPQRSFSEGASAFQLRNSFIMQLMQQNIIFMCTVLILYIEGKIKSHQHTSCDVLTPLQLGVLPLDTRCCKH